MLPSLPLAFVNSVWGWVIILFIALLLFGKRLPGVARNMGRGITEFKKGLNEGSNSANRPDDDDDKSASRPPSKTDIDHTSV